MCRKYIDPKINSAESIIHIIYFRMRIKIQFLWVSRSTGVQNAMANLGF